MDIDASKAGHWVEPDREMQEPGMFDGRNAEIDRAGRSQWSDGDGKE